MNWSPRQARFTLLLFLLVFGAGQVEAYLSRPVFPEPKHVAGSWPPAGHLVDTTALENRSLEVFPGGTTIASAVVGMGLEAHPLGSGFCLPRAGILHRASAGWRIRPMSQRERWVWRIPMNINNCVPDDLQRINGIGPSLAGKIHRFVQGRGYLASISELDEVPGVGPGKMKALEKELALN